MTKATCTKCGFEVFLRGPSPNRTYLLSIKDSIANLIEQIKSHRCHK